MAKKRRLSKRDRAIKAEMRTLKGWDLVMENEEFKTKLFYLLNRIDPSFSGFLQKDGCALKYFAFDGENLSNIYFVAFLNEEGVEVLEEALPAFETTF